MKLVGILLVIIAIMGLLYACGNLVALPLMQDQLREALPEMGTAIDKATAISRDKTYIGIVVCTLVLTFGVVLIRRSVKTKSNKADGTMRQ